MCQKTTSLKSSFITIYSIAVILVTALAGVPVSLAGWRSPWMGVLIATWPAVFFFVRLARLPTARASRTAPYLPVLGGIGVVFAVYIGGLGPAARIAGLIGVAGSLVYLSWYSSFGPRPAGLLAVGRTLPESELMDLDGTTIRSGAFIGRTNLWIFFRGNWCPLCLAQIREVAAQYRQLATRGVQVPLVSPQPARLSQVLAEKFGVPTTYLVDEDNQAAPRLGILAPNGLPLGLELAGYDSDVPMPTVFITSAEGRIAYSDLTDNYRVRPDSQDFLTVVDRLCVAEVDMRQRVCGSGSRS